MNKYPYWKIAALLILLVGLMDTVYAQDNPDGIPDPDSVTIAGTVQSLLGCPGDWQPECEATVLTYDAGADVWTGTFDLPAGSYEYKVALNGNWDVNYGLNGEEHGANIPLMLEEDMTITFVYDHKTGIVTDGANQEAGAGAGESGQTPLDIPDIVNIPGTIQPALGCSGEWAPDCEATMLEYDAAYDVWSRTFDLPTGSYEYKVAINGSWTENYGGYADLDGPNIILTVDEDTTITFFYDHKTHWISDDVRHLVVTAPGSYQSEIGCADDWQPECMLSWLQDVDGDGIYSYTANGIPAGDYEVKAAINRSWDENYGVDGELDGANIPLTVPEDGTPVTFLYDSNLHAMVVSTGGARFLRRI